MLSITHLDSVEVHVQRELFVLFVALDTEGTEDKFSPAGGTGLPLWSTGTVCGV